MKLLSDTVGVAMTSYIVITSRARNCFKYCLSHQHIGQECYQITMILLGKIRWHVY